MWPDLARLLWLSGWGIAVILRSNIGLRTPFQVWLGWDLVQVSPAWFGNLERTRLQPGEIVLPLLLRLVNPGSDCRAGPMTSSKAQAPLTRRCLKLSTWSSMGTPTREDAWEVLVLIPC